MSAWISVVGWALIHFVWQGIVLAVVTAVVLRACRQRSANTRYLVACVGLVLMVVTPVVTAGGLWSATGPLPAAVVATPSAAPETAAAARVSGADDHLFVSTHPWDLANTVLPSMVFIWLGGVLLLTTRLAGGLWRVRHLRLRSMAQAASSWQAVADRVATRLGLRAVVRVVESRLVDTPTVVGWLRPLILLPIAAVTNLSPAQVEAVLAHELAHVRRHDYLVNVVQALAETLLFYHPAVWWVSRRIRTEREHCCDDVAVAICDDRVTYATALAELEAGRARGIGLALAASRGPLLGRVRRVLNVPIEHDPHALGWACSIGVTLLVVLGAGGVLPSPIQGPDAHTVLASAQQTDSIASPDTFDWQVETTEHEHFELYYYPALAATLEPLGADAERAYARVSEALDHRLAFIVPLILFKTREDFVQQGIAEIPDAVLENVTSFSEPRRDRIVILLDEDPDRWELQITHELTHIFQFDIVSDGLTTSSGRVPSWILEGMADYLTGVWDPDQLAQLREVVVADRVPQLSTLRENEDGGSGLHPVALGHAAFDFIEAEYGAERVKQFLLELRRAVLEGSDDLYEATLQLTPDEFDQAFESYLRQRFEVSRQGQAQSPGAFVAGQEKITLDLEVYEKGELIGSASLIVVDGETGSIHRPDFLGLKFTPTRLENGVAIDLEFEVDEEIRNSRIEIRQGQPASIGWPDGTDVRITLGQD